MYRVNHYKLLLHFGSVMTNLNVCGITFNLDPYKYSLGSYINISCVQKYMNQKMRADKKPFPCLRKLNLFGSFFGNEILNLIDECSPNLICFKLSVVRFQRSDILERRIPLLEHLTICNAIEKSRPMIYQNFFSNNRVTSAIRLNPSLVSLCLTHDGNGIGIEVNGDLLNFINRELPILKNLNFASNKTLFFWITMAKILSSKI